MDLLEMGRALHERYELAARIARSVWPAAETSPEAMVAAAATCFIELNKQLGPVVSVPGVTPSAPASAVVSSAPTGNPFGPTEKQVAFYQRLAQSSVFTPEERQRAAEWLATRATRQTIKDQIDWLKGQVETRKAHTNGRAT